VTWRSIDHNEYRMGTTAHISIVFRSSRFVRFSHTLVSLILSL